MKALEVKKDAINVMGITWVKGFYNIQDDFFAEQMIKQGAIEVGGGAAVSVAAVVEAREPINMVVQPQTPTVDEAPVITDADLEEDVTNGPGDTGAGEGEAGHPAERRVAGRRGPGRPRRSK